MSPHFKMKKAAVVFDCGFYFFRCSSRFACLYRIGKWIEKQPPIRAAVLLFPRNYGYDNPLADRRSAGGASATVLRSKWWCSATKTRLAFQTANGLKMTSTRNPRTRSRRPIADCGPSRTSVPTGFCEIRALCVAVSLVAEWEEFLLPYQFMHYCCCRQEF